MATRCSLSIGGKVLGSATLTGGVAQLHDFGHPGWDRRLVVANYSGDANYLPAQVPAILRKWSTSSANGNGSSSRLAGNERSRQF